MASIVINAGGVTGNDTAAPTLAATSDYPRWQENTANRWHIKAICYLVIAPTAIATAATAFFDASMGAALGSSPSDKAVLSALVRAAMQAVKAEPGQHTIDVGDGSGKAYAYRDGPERRGDGSGLVVAAPGADR